MFWGPGVMSTIEKNRVFFLNRFLQIKWPAECDWREALVKKSNRAVLKLISLDPVVSAL